MTPNRRRFRFSGACLCGAILFAAAFLSGCATTKGPLPSPLPVGDIVQEDTAPENAWWRAKIRFVWPEGEGPRWFLDLLAADRVIKPVLVRHRHTIRLWRFHRRAVRDLAGHQFSFIFYSDRDTAQRVFSEIRTDPLIGELRGAGLLDETVFSDLSGDPAFGIGATSDRNWSEALQNAWPHYIMGVSALWLELIHQAADGVPPPADSTEALLAYYRDLDASLDEIWRDEAHHAFLHHLNAIFGYRPMLIRKMMRF